MIRCPSCDATYAENTLFCEECGASLMTQNNHTTDRLPASEPVCEAVGGSVAPRTLILSIRDGARIEIPFSKEVVLGRLDTSRAIFPDIDLTNEGGLGRGVSRRHARIFRTQDGIAIEDLASLNGTFVNGQRLTPETPYPIQDGDELQIGRLILTVNLC